jgi:hypothetical protein
MDSGLIIEGTRLAEVVRDDLRRALSTCRLSASEDAEFYVVTLLCNAGEAARMPALCGDDQALGVRLLEALADGSHEKGAALREIGDSVLLALGLFEESILGGIVDRSYYLSIGGSAYDALSGITICDSVFAAVYAELASNFAGFVKALSMLAPCNRPSSDAELLAIYRRWLESRDERLARLLRREGMLSEDS